VESKSGVKGKTIFLLLLLYGILAAFFYWYLFVYHGGKDPSLEGTPADPSSFMTERELILSERYSDIRNFLFFLEAPYEWLIYGAILVFGLSRTFERWAEGMARRFLIKVAIFTFCLSFTMAAALFPVQYLSYRISRFYGISAQTFSAWMRDFVISFWIDWLFLFVIAGAVLFLIRKFPRKWWLAAWAAAVPFVIFVMYIQPVLIDPLYNDFYPIRDQGLEKQILNMAHEAGVPAERVFEVDMSTKTNALNAYVTGIGNNARIVLWDTTLKSLDDGEILFIMAHEIAHYVEKHIYFGIAGSLLLLFAGLFIAGCLIGRIVKRYGALLKIRSQQSLSVLPLLFVLMSIMTFMVSPLSNAVSRHMEERADRFAIEITRDVDAGVAAFQKLAKTGLSQVDPPLLVKWFRYGHPTMKERIYMLEEYRDDAEGH